MADFAHANTQFTMHNPDRFIASCKSWGDFYERTKAFSTQGAKGAAFERLTQLYLQTTPEYRTELQDVWLLGEVPADIRKRLNLPGPDEGIDLLARTRRGEYWAIQSKFRSQRDKPLNRRELGTFTSLAFNTCNDIAWTVVAHTCTKPPSKHHLMRKTVEIGLDRQKRIFSPQLVAQLDQLVIGRLPVGAVGRAHIGAETTRRYLRYSLLLMSFQQVL
jgi:hypothetical protein